MNVMEIFYFNLLYGSKSHRDSHLWTLFPTQSCFSSLDAFFPLPCFRFHCDIPDDFLFTSMATLDQLAQSAQLGTLTAEQKAFYEGHSVEKAAGGGEGEIYPCLRVLSYCFVTENPGGKKARDPNAPSTVIVQSNKQPCCPWFTICF